MDLGVRRRQWSAVLAVLAVLTVLSMLIGPSPGAADERRPTNVSFGSTLTAGAPWDEYQLRVDVNDEPEGSLITGTVTIWSRNESNQVLTRLVEAEPSGNGIHVSNQLMPVAPVRTLWVEYSGSEMLQPSRSEDLVITSAKIPTTTTLELDATTIGDGEAAVATVQVTPAPGNLPPDPIARLQLRSEADDFLTLAVPIDPDTGTGTATIDASELDPGVWTATAEFPIGFDHSLRFTWDRSDPVELARDPFGSEPVPTPAPYPFWDVEEGDRFAADIAWAFHEGVTAGCGEGAYCPDGMVTRGQMATFLSRALHLPATATDYFTDDETNRHEAAINRLRAAGITSGCGPGRFCPDGLVTRAQMATFLSRALHLPSTPTDYFGDDETSRHESAINRLRAAEITSGCGPGRFCPDGMVTRGQMAAFLHRAMGD